MNRYALVVLALSAAACGNSEPAATAAKTTDAPSPPETVTRAAANDDAATVSGVVVETMNSGGYTYARLATGGGEIWIAGSEFPVAVRDTITAAVDMPMENFHSRTLNRSFAVIYFVREVTSNGRPLTAAAAAAPVAMPAPAMAGSHGADAPPTLIAPVAAAPGGVTVASVWAKRQTLSGQPVVVRGRLVKVNYDIMGTNWYHLQDGTGVVAEGTHDLVVTSAAQVKAGEVVTVSGVLTTGKDFGAGYAYEAIVEQADIRK